MGRFLIGVKLSFVILWGRLVTNNGGSREWWCWWVGSNCIVYLSGVVDEKDERACIDPSDTIFNTPLENSLTSSPFHDAHLPLLGARFHRVNLFLSSVRSSASHSSSSSNSLVTLLLAGSDAVVKQQCENRESDDIRRSKLLRIFTSASLKTPTIPLYLRLPSLYWSKYEWSQRLFVDIIMKMRCNSPSLISRCKKRGQIMSATWFNWKKTVTLTKLACQFPQLWLIDNQVSPNAGYADPLAIGVKSIWCSPQ